MFDSLVVVGLGKVVVFFLLYLATMMTVIEKGKMHKNYINY